MEAELRVRAQMSSGHSGPGRQAIVDHLPSLREKWALDCVIINGENAAGGFGITPQLAEELRRGGEPVADQRQVLRDAAGGLRNKIRIPPLFSTARSTSPEQQ